MSMEKWEVWYPNAAATGLLFGRGDLDATEVLLVHAVPDVITVEVRDEDGRRVAYAADLQRTQPSPICRLTRNGDTVSREDIWPTELDYELPLLVSGGEVGRLKAWWNATDRKEWRWSIELYNSNR